MPPQWDFFLSFSLLFADMNGARRAQEAEWAGQTLGLRTEPVLLYPLQLVMCGVVDCVDCGPNHLILVLGRVEARAGWFLFVNSKTAPPG